MSTDEFEEEAQIWHHLVDLDRTDAIAAACRGSGNPAVLAWIADALEIGPRSLLVDIGAGLGGPAAWLTTHHRCTVLTSDPVPDAARGSREVFSNPSVVARGTQLPFRDDAADAALALGVLSVVDDPRGVLREARRLAPRIALITYVSTSTSEVDCGGSTFSPRREFLDELADAGWEVEHGPAPADMSPPADWDDAALPDRPDDPCEAEVEDALDAGHIEPVITIARDCVGQRRR